MMHFELDWQELFTAVVLTPETVFCEVFKVTEQTPHLRHIANNAKERKKAKKQVKNMIPALKKHLLGGDLLCLSMERDIDLKML